jgi:hypothetical protein
VDRPAGDRYIPRYYLPTLHLNECHFKLLLHAQRRPYQFLQNGEYPLEVTQICLGKSGTVPSARVNLPHNMQFTAASYVDPQGKIRYTLGIGAYVCRLQGLMGSISRPESFRFPKFVAKGKALDPDGNPVEGAAIHIDGKVAYSDSNGVFMVRLSRTGPHPLSVALDEFITPGTWEVLEAPSAVSGQPEERANSIAIVLCRRKQLP